MTQRVVRYDVADLPPQPLAAIHVVRMIKDDNVSTTDLARIVETDPALSARVIRLANSPYYGVSRRVGSASRAVVLLGLTTVRALCVGATLKLVSSESAESQAGEREAGAQDLDPEDFAQVEHQPPIFWAHSLLAAVSASVVARRVGGSADEAFSAGLLHDVGMLLAPADDSPHQHATIGAEALDRWCFPRHFVRAVGLHHHPPAGLVDTLARVVVAGESLAIAMHNPGPDHVDGAPLDEALETIGIAATRAEELLDTVERETNKIVAFLGRAQ